MRLSLKTIIIIVGLFFIVISMSKFNTRLGKLGLDESLDEIRGLLLNRVVIKEERQFNAAPIDIMLQNETFDIAVQENDVPSITIVTLFIKLGTLQKASGTRALETYKQWMITWGWLGNPVVAFFEDEEILQYFKQIRSKQPAHKTVIVKVNRSQLDAFKNLERIKQIYSSSSYSKLPPTMVDANYCCTMSAKYDVMNMALDMGLVKTKYLAWMDIGLFRTLLEDRMKHKNKNFTLEVPSDFNSSRVGFAEVAPRQSMEKYSPWDYIKNSYVWLAGGYVMGTHQVIRTFTQSYKSTVHELLKANMSSTDEQIIGAMYSPAFRHKQQLDVHGYSCVDGQFGLHGTDPQYFCLSYICKETAEREKNKTSILKEKLKRTIL